MALLGAKELKADLRSIAANVQAANRSAAFAAAQLLRDRAKFRAPRRTGQSARKIVAVRKRGTPGVGLSLVGFRRSAFYLQILEKGAKPHPIPKGGGNVGLTSKIINPRTRARIGTRTKKRAVLAFVSKGTLFFRPRVQSPGVRKRPFLLPAFAASRQEMEALMRQVYNAALAKRTGGAGAP